LAGKSVEQTAFHQRKPSYERTAGTPKKEKIDEINGRISNGSEIKPTSFPYHSHIKEVHITFMCYAWKNRKKKEQTEKF
jgi:hypothetical protein